MEDGGYIDSSDPERTPPTRRRSRSFDLGDLKKALATQERDVIASELEKLRIDLSTLGEKRDRAQESLTLAQQGYNDVGISILELQKTLETLQIQITALEVTCLIRFSFVVVVVVVRQLQAKIVQLSSTLSEGGTSPQFRHPFLRIMPQLKLELSPLDPRFFICFFLFCELSLLFNF